MEFFVGIRSDVACCDWSDGKPKQGHVQEAAREMRCVTWNEWMHCIGGLISRMVVFS